MNYFEHHIGDYDKNTAHLSACEDGIYHRMIRRYLDKEEPLIADVPKLERVLRARTKDERAAVAAVLDEFFELRDDGWHNKTCDEVLAAYWAGEPEREVKKANETNRLTRHREERARLFKVLTDAGQHAPWNIAMNELRAMADRVAATAPEAPAPPLPATAPATPATATQTPNTRHQTPDTNPQGVIHSVPIGTGAEAPPPALVPQKPAKAQTPAEAEKARLWAWVKSTLVEQKASADIKAAGTLAGKLAAKYGADVFADAARAAMASPPVDLHTYLVGLCETAAGKRVSLGRPGHMTDQQREAANAAATEDAMRRLLAGRAGGDVIDAEVTEWHPDQLSLEAPHGH